MSNHTPGPWRWGYWLRHEDTDEIEFLPAPENTHFCLCAGCEYGYRINSGHGRLLNVISGTMWIERADMDLIARAPDLLATQAKLLEACKEAVTMDDSAHCDHDPWLTPDVRDMMTAAIAETEREKP